ncbi:glycosyltransferase family 4 protein [Algoriphagus sp. H41]|uniref:Glycosyltransferase family 4 protein n=1 Tax=Algoriphagus oliviformis TaxID=2811231 RepID=A0ABS3C8Q5_9BACT|nr:glycosyltransferase [Algoriphagus oliviformis]MBN7812954.1 glycosyltransferase family 4 protein [Algoriphagus oliviformis]
MNKSILFLSESGPFPPRDGKKQRTLALLDALAEAYQIDYLIVGNRRDFEVAQNENPYESTQFHYLPVTTSRTDYWKKKLGYVFGYDANLVQACRAMVLGKEYHLVFSRYIKPVHLVPEGIRIVADVDDDFEELYNSRIKRATSMWEKVRLCQIKWLNLGTYRKLQSRLNLAVVTKPEGLCVRQLVLPNLPFQSMVKKKVSFTSCSALRILYVGKLSYEPNIKGLTWFLDSVLPILRLLLPRMVTTVVSSEVPQNQELAQLLDDSGVEVFYNVESLDVFYAKSAVVVAPVFQGAGTNLKVVEALFHGRPVVSTEFGCKGFSSEVPEGYLFCHDSPEDFANQVSVLLQSSELSTLQASLRDWAIAKYSIEAWSKSLLEACV